MTIVLDSSVIIKWFKKAGEEKTDEADKYFKQCLNNKVTIAVPALLFYEFINIASSNKTIFESDWKESLEKLFSLPLEIYPLDVFSAKETYQISKQYDLTAYDATYLALASRLKTVLVTCDKELIKKGGSLVREL